MPQMRVIPTEKLDVDPDVQLLFAFSPARVRAMSANWRPEKVGFLIVVPDGNGGFLVVDGRHRLRAGTAAGVTEWRCDVHDDIAHDDVARKAALKLGFDRDRRHVSALEHFLIRVLAGDISAVEIDQIVRACGFEIGKKSGKSETARKLGCVSTLDKIYRLFGADKFRRTIQLNTHWIDDAAAANADWIASLSLLVRDDYDYALKPESVEKMRMIVPALAVRHAHGQLVRRGVVAHQGAATHAFNALNYEIAAYIRKKSGLRQRPAVRRSARDQQSRPIE